MRIIYKLDENDIRKILADRFEALPEDVKFTYLIDRDCALEERAQVRIEIDTVQE